MIHPGIGRVLTKEVQVSEGLLVMPDAAKVKEVRHYEVIEVGPIYNGSVKVDPLFKPGDRLMFPPRVVGYDVKYKGQVYVMVDYQDIMGFEPKDELIDPLTN